MFKTLRAKLIFSYSAVVVLSIVLGLIVSIALVRSVSDRNIYQNLREKAALGFPFIQRELAGEVDVAASAVPTPVHCQADPRSDRADGVP